MTKNASLSIAVVAEYDSSFAPHPATTESIEHSARQLGIEASTRWISTEDISPTILEICSAIWIGPGSPYKNLRKALDVIYYARLNDIPCLGTCGGFQHMIIEYARNVLGFVDAQHAEYDPYSSRLFVSALACSPAGKQLRIDLVPDSLIARCYGTTTAMEQYYCNFGLNPEVARLFEGGAMKVSGRDADGEVRVIEISRHAFFLGILYVPQMRSSRNAPHPVVTAFLRAAMMRAGRNTNCGRS